MGTREVRSDSRFINLYTDLGELPVLATCFEERSHLPQGQD